MNIDEAKAELKQLADQIPHAKNNVFNEILQAIEDSQQVGSSGLLPAAMSVLGKIKLIHADNEYKAVWEAARMHRGRDYEGLNYVKELEALEVAINKALPG